MAQRVFAVVGRLVRKDDGQDLLEYGLVVTLIAIGAVMAVTTVGNTIRMVLWETIAQSF